MSTKKKSKTTGEHAGEAKKPHQKRPKAQPAAKPHFGDSNKVSAVMVTLKKAAARPPLEVKEQKDGLMLVSPTTELGGREFARTMLGTKPYRTVLVQEFSNSVGTNNTVYNIVFPADLALASDITSWLSLFDEMRGDSTEMRAIPYVGASAAAQPISPLVYSLAFDPMEAAAVSSTAANIKATRHIGPLSTGISTGVSIGASQYGSCLNTVTNRGHLSLHSGPLIRDVLPASSGGVLQVNPVCGSWVPTTTASAVLGYYKWYAEALSVSQFFGTRCYIMMTAEFRIRG